MEILVVLPKMMKGSHQNVKNELIRLQVRFNQEICKQVCCRYPVHIISCKIIILLNFRAPCSYHIWKKKDMQLQENSCLVTAEVTKDNWQDRKDTRQADGNT